MQLFDVEIYDRVLFPSMKQRYTVLENIPQLLIYCLTFCFDGSQIMITLRDRIPDSLRHVENFKTADVN